MNAEEEKLNCIALSRVNFYHLDDILRLYREAGSATAVAEASGDIRQLMPEANARTVETFRDFPLLRRKAGEEMEWAAANGVKVLTMADEDYPERLSECPDAPLVLFFKGTAKLNRPRVINIVGTRRCTVYGEDLIRRFVSDLRTLLPDALIISGLAYGVDICAHRSALKEGFDTIGVLAHGLDDLYPPRHRATAEQMLLQGGLLTEYTTHTKPDKLNFVRRNRIVAGCCDATILIESAAHGGGLITCRMANDYNRAVFAFPGNVGAEYSEGCNNLIRDNGAQLITSASDFVKAMCWDDVPQTQTTGPKTVERQLFPNLSAEERQVVEALRKQNDQQLNLLSLASGLTVQRLSTLLFTLEMKGVVKSIAGNSFHLL